jgi:N-acetylmuramoyl-L-alanine amidase
MKRIFIEAGHNNSDSGAIGNGFKEADLTKEARNILVQNLKLMGYTGEIITDADAHSLGDTIKYFNSLTPKADDILISLHFNAASNTEAKGAEVLHRYNASETVKTFCREMAAIVVKDTPFKLRGTVGIVNENMTPHKKLGILQLVPTSGLIEFCFISNRDEILTYAALKHTILNNLAVFLFKNGRA